MTLEETIKHAEYIVNNRKYAISVCWSVKDCEQIAEWLKELAERRKQPERKVGEWVQVPRFEGDTQPYLECPFCKNQVGWWDLARYCAGCGAKLEGGAG